MYHYNLESISNENDQEWNKIVLWHFVGSSAKSSVAISSYTSYLPALMFEGASTFKFNNRNPLCYTHTNKSLCGTFPQQTSNPAGDACTPVRGTAHGTVWQDTLAMLMLIWNQKLELNGKVQQCKNRKEKTGQRGRGNKKKLRHKMDSNIPLQ